MKCAKCGKDMTSPEGETVIALSLSIPADHETSPEMKEHLRRQLGKYGLGTYNFCWECWLDSLFGGSNASP